MVMVFSPKTGNLTVREMRDILSLIDSVPAADVEPVRYGRWVESDLDKDYITCSECKRMKLMNRRAWNKSAFNDWGLNYCSNCGAKMDGEEDDG